MSKIPLYGTACIVIMVIAAVVLVLFANPATAPSLSVVIGLLVTTVPSLVAAVFSERAAKDIRNGVLTEKVVKGTKQALQEHGVVVRDGPAATAALTALAQILEKNTQVTEKNTQIQEQNGGDDNGGGSTV